MYEIILPLLFGTGILALILHSHSKIHYCSRCGHGTYFVQFRNIRINRYYYLQIPYCLKCWFYINLSKYECDNCKRSGTHRIHELNFISRLRVIQGKKIVLKRCNCGNLCELVKK